MSRKKPEFKQLDRLIDQKFLTDSRNPTESTVVRHQALPDDPTVGSPATEDQVKALVFTRELENGSTPVQAAHAAGTTLQAFTSSVEFRAAVIALIQRANLPAEARKQFVRAFQNETLLRASTSNDPRDLKIGLEAAKQISQDPEIGLMNPEGSSVIINLGSLGELIRNEIKETESAADASAERPKDPETSSGTGAGSLPADTV